jgi:hypothetical protein
VKNWGPATVASNYSRTRQNGMTIHRLAAPALIAQFKAASQSVIAEWKSRSGAQGQAILEQFLAAHGNATGPG